MSDFLCCGCMEHVGEGQPCSCGFDGSVYRTAPHHLIPGTLIRNRYVLGKVLGEGGFGITYVGRDAVLDLKVAVKEFYMTGYVNRNNTFSPMVEVSVGRHAEQFLKNKEKFLKEARVLAKFANEKGIVGIRDFFEDNNTAYIVMDFLTGETLKSHLKEVGKLSWQETIKLMTPVINSLAQVHKQNIIHRDISPDNIMLTDKGEVSLLDFGAAREVSDTDIKSLSVILKPGFAPEEQYRSKGQQGPWTDIYALCATIYSCITGVLPDDSMERMFEDNLKSPHELEPSCGLAISNVIMKGMAVRQKDRYQTIDELLSDLELAKANPEDGSIAAQELSSPQIPAQFQATAPQAAPVARSVGDANATVFAEEIVDAFSEQEMMDSQATTVLEQEPAGEQFLSAVASENPGQEVPVTQGRPDIDMPVAQGQMEEPVAQGQEVPVAGVGAEFQNQGMEATQGQPEVAPAYGSQLQPVPEVAPGYGSQPHPVPEVAPGYGSQPQPAPQYGANYQPVVGAAYGRQENNGEKPMSAFEQAKAAAKNRRNKGI